MFCMSGLPILLVAAQRALGFAYISDLTGCQARTTDLTGDCRKSDVSTTSIHEQARYGRCHKGV
jgi:hypothetical protein